MRLTKGVPIACADFSFPLLSHEVALHLISGMGIQAVDISLMAGYSHLDVAQVLQHPAQAGRELSAKLRANGLQVADINFAPGEDFETLALNHPDLSVRHESEEQFRQAIEFAAEAGARHMTLLPGVHWTRESRDASLQRTIDELHARLAYGAEAGIVVSVEPHLGSIVPTPTSTEHLLAVMPELTLTLDYTHFIYQGFVDSECAPLLPRASHFHARGGAPQRLQTTLKKSTIDYDAVLRTMIAIGYRGYFAIEYVWMDWEDCNQTDNVSETVLLLKLARSVFDEHRKPPLTTSR